MKRAATAALACLAPACFQGEGADVVLRSGTIYTLDEGGTVAEAMAIREGQIEHIGTNEEVQGWIGQNTQVIELAGKVVLPGFHDSHTHLVWSAADLLNVDLFEVTTVEEMQEVVLEWATEHPEAEWVTGGGWDMSIFEGLLHHDQLDQVVPDRPVILYAADGHSAFVNALAMELAGITADTPDPEDGVIDRDEDGEPTGVLRESAMSLVDVLVPVYPDAQVDQGLDQGLWEASSYGITTIIDANVDDWMLAGYARAQARGTLSVRVKGAVEIFPGDPDNLSRVEALATQFNSDLIEVNAGKLYLDGIIESQTAAMLEPYEDGSNAPLIFTDEELREVALALNGAGFQLHAHAIGDGAVRQMLDVVEHVRSAQGGLAHPPLVAHLEVIDPADVPRFAELGVLANFQPLWAYPDPYIVDLTWPVIGPERSEWLYPMGAVLDTGGTLVAGSDWSVSSMNPFEAIEVAVTRQDPWEEGGEVLTPQHLIPLEAAIRAYTSGGALAARSDLTGSLEPSHLADFVVLDRDPFTVSAQELSDVVVEQTWLGGMQVYARQAGRPAPRARRPHGAGCRHP